MFYYVSRITLVVILALVAAILHQSALNAREQIDYNVTEQVDLYEPGNN